MFGKLAYAAAVVLIGGAALGQPAPPPQAKHPPGIPGFYDPLTRRFTPLANAPGSKTFGGRQEIFISVAAPESVDTVFCDVDLEFGNFVNKQFFPNHFARVDVNFNPGTRRIRESIPFKYTPNGRGKPRMKIIVQCQGTDNVTKERYFNGHYGDDEPVVNNPPDARVTIYLGNV